MSLDFVHERKEDTITIRISGVSGETFFILRTHGEEIADAQGAAFKRMEKDAYLICAQEPEVTLYMKRGNEL